jgi:tetratricopeptide (TPR) repeat protein
VAEKPFINQNRNSVGTAGARGISFALAVSLFSALGFLSGCTSQNPRDRFMLAEKLWQEKNYPAAIAEYEKVIQKDPSSQIGVQAGYRAAMTQTLFLNEHLAALRKLNRIIEGDTDPEFTYESYRQIGEILFTKLEQYEQAIQHYERMLELYPKDINQAEYIYRIGKAQFHLLKFEDSIRTLKIVVDKHRGTEWAKKARYEMAVSQQTKGHQLQTQETRAAQDAFKESVKQYEQFIKLYPDDPLALQARFEIGNCYEEMDQVDAAYKIFEEIRDKYPNRTVVELKLKRIHDRKNQKNL